MNRYLFIGLGNPGSKYQLTRHNLGIRTLRAYLENQHPSASDFKDWHSSRFNAELAYLTLGDIRVTCLFPVTSMNKSGQAARSFLHSRLSRLWQSLPLNHILIIHDDLELRLGDVKIKTAGSARGHNGVRSIHQALGTQNIPRLLLGIGPKPSNNITNFVLGKFEESEEEIINQSTIPQALQAITTFARTKNPPHYPTDERHH